MFGLYLLSTRVADNGSGVVVVEDEKKEAMVESEHKVEYSVGSLETNGSPAVAAGAPVEVLIGKYENPKWVGLSRDSSRRHRSVLQETENVFLMIGSSDEGISKLLDRVEVIYIKHFADGNRKKGLKTLRPRVKKEKHKVTASLGFFASCTVALIFALILVVRTRKIVEKDGHEQYMETLFPLYSFFGFIVLHMVFYAGNIYFWKKYKINYQFIFGFKAGTELGYREVLLLSFGLSVLALASIHANLDMQILILDSLIVMYYLL
ncbi:hypothetical protein POM88_040461 [Heracleum sosnowskyi]|uniref:EXS domain-containing protein n=1 Tax=Heracleum sosnowskyi TaxID=360622 RepID=A0AAD8HF15_9APIA|nr:hypothetical protein POM88_040461 [Heracleum sosnowskyi]